MSSQVYPSSFGDVFYDRRGLGDPVLLVHGLYAGASGEEYHRNLAALAKRFTVYAVDLPGFGDSDAPKMTYTAQGYHHLLRDFVVDVIRAPAHVVASGLSCGLGVRLGVYNEELVGKLVLISPADRPDAADEPGLLQHVQQFVLGTMNVGASLYETIASEGALGQFLRSRYHDPRKATDERLKTLTYNASRVNSMYPFISLMTRHLDTDLFRWLRYVRPEVLVLWGQSLGPPPYERVLRPATWSRGKRLEVIDQAGHWPHDERSAQVNELIRGFLTDPH
jgi:pimeloyl-ACP methyl ester carboxylesterase